MNLVRPVMVALVSANAVNAAGNWAFVYGHLGLPALGAVGSAYATIGARIYLAAFLWAVIVYRERARPSGLHDVPLAFDPGRVWQLVRIGLPAAMQVVLEVGVFATASALAGRISPLALAANQIVLNIVGFVFMVPFGLSSAAAVRVGQAAGRGDAQGVRVAGWVALGLSLVFALTMSAAFSWLPGPFLRVFTSDPALVGVGATLLFVCAAFQPFDGFQVVATGALRGLGETRTPMLLNLTAHWFVGLPLGYWLCFGRAWGVEGLWLGLTVSLILIGAVLLGVWHRRSRAFARAAVVVDAGR
jgi:MATE family multidrug resistance protein